MSFCNSTIKPVDISKPHIVFKSGQWCIQPMPPAFLIAKHKTAESYWQQAWEFVRQLNDGLNYPWGYKNTNV